MAREDLLLEVNGITKRFGGIVAVENVSFKVHEGEAVSYTHLADHCSYQHTCQHSREEGPSQRLSLIHIFAAFNSSISQISSRKSKVI